MELYFLYHVCILASIYFILACWFRFLFEIKMTLDFSYMALIIFCAYFSAFLNNFFEIWMILAMLISLVPAILFMLFVHNLSRRLSWYYFLIWTLCFYIFSFQLVRNLDIVWGAQWISLKNLYIIGDFYLKTLESKCIAIVLVSMVLALLTYLYKLSWHYKILKWGGHSTQVLSSIWLTYNTYSLFVFLIIVVFASIGANFLLYYISFIDPYTFWLPVVITLLMLALFSYRYNEFVLYLASFILVAGLEYLRFFRVVDPSKIGVVKEIIFSLLIIVVAYFAFKKMKFLRQE